MELIDLLLDNFDTLMAWACMFFLFYGAALFFESRLPARDPRPEESHVHFFGD